MVWEVNHTINDQLVHELVTASNNIIPNVLKLIGNYAHVQTVDIYQALVCSPPH